MAHLSSCRRRTAPWFYSLTSPQHAERRIARHSGLINQNEKRDRASCPVGGRTPVPGYQAHSRRTIEERSRTLQDNTGGRRHGKPAAGLPSVGYDVLSPGPRRWTGSTVSPLSTFPHSASLYVSMPLFSEQCKAHLGYDTSTDCLSVIPGGGGVASHAFCEVMK